MSLQGRDTIDSAFSRDTTGSRDTREELFAMQQQANRIADESLQSTRRMVGLVDESEEAGGKTLKMLDEQGEQLNRVEKGADSIDRNMKDAEKNMEQLEKCCGLCVCPCNKYQDGEASRKGFSKDETVIKRQPRSRNYSHTEHSYDGRFITRVMNDAREDEMEENLDHVGKVVGKLKHMAKDMGNEIDFQNKQIDRLNYKVESDTERVNEGTSRADKILRRS